jgi:hypothetical protein
MKKIMTLAVLFTFTIIGVAEAAWQQRAIFNPDGLKSHTWQTTTITLPACSTTSVILQKAQSPGTAVQLLYNSSTNTACQAAINTYVDQMIQRNPNAGAVDFIR